MRPYLEEKRGFGIFILLCFLEVFVDYLTPCWTISTGQKNPKLTRKSSLLGVEWFDVKTIYKKIESVLCKTLVFIYLIK